MTAHLIRYQAATIAAFQQHRDGETRLGETLYWPHPTQPLADCLAKAKSDGVRFVVLGIAEDIGPRANFGQPGATQGFEAFLRRFLNLQANSFIDAKQIMVLGEIECRDLQQQSTHLQPHQPAQLTQLRELCAHIDQRATVVLQHIFAAGLLPIVIGGGHNNALPLLQALATHYGQAIHAINLDPHCDFRLLEGRHSGNGFSYAKQQNWLSRYFVLGLHELKNSESALQQMQQAQVGYCSYQAMFLRQEITFADAIQQAIRFIQQQPAPFGIELDTDSINLMPVSAFTNCGLTVREAEHYVWQLARLPDSKYLHLAEAAPLQHPAGLTAGMSEAGQILTALVVAFIQAKQQQLPN